MLAEPLATPEQKARAEETVLKCEAVIRELEHRLGERSDASGAPASSET